MWYNRITYHFSKCHNLGNSAKKKSMLQIRTLWMSTVWKYGHYIATVSWLLWKTVSSKCDGSKDLLEFQNAFYSKVCSKLPLTVKSLSLGPYLLSNQLSNFRSESTKIFATDVWQKMECARQDFLADNFFSVFSLKTVNIFLLETMEIEFLCTEVIPKSREIVWCCFKINCIENHEMYS